MILMMKFFLCMIIMILKMQKNWWVSIFFLISLMTSFIFFISLNEGVKIIGFNIYMDTLSFSLCYLSLWLSVLMLISSNMFLKFSVSKNMFLMMVLFLCLVLLVSFLTSNYMMFYFFFEISLIPTLLIIGGWGFQPERLGAGVYFMLYTLTASLPLLLGLFYMYSKFGSLSMNIGMELFSSVPNVGSILLALAFVMAFLVKMPMFFVHLWLPKAHVEAPVAGSMILAGVLLKLGGYGISRILMKFYGGIMLLSPYIIGLSLFGMVYVGLICCRMNDMKALVAYSSVAHMGLVLGGIFSGFFWGLSGSLAMMISHGISSSGLFCIVNMYYERSSSRSLFLNKGLILILPFFSLMMFLLCGANVSAPPTINLLSEIMLMVSVMAYDSFMMVVFPLGSFLGAVFTFYFFSYTQHGKPSSSKNMLVSRFSELHVLLLHIIPLNFLIMKPEVVFMWL